MTSGFQDHPLLTLSWAVTSNTTLLDTLTRNGTFLSEELALWTTNKTGYLVNSAGNQWGWLRVPDDEQSIWEDGNNGKGRLEDPSAGPTAAHYELIFTVNILSMSVTEEVWILMPVGD